MKTNSAGRSLTVARVEHDANSDRRIVDRPDRLLWHCLLVASVLVATAQPTTARELRFETLFIRPSDSLHAECHNGILAYRIESWRRRDRRKSNPFSSVEDIMADVSPPALDALTAKGCDDRYIWTFLSCTSIDWPNDLSPNIKPLGVAASTQEAMAAHMRGCLVRLSGEGLSPARSWSDHLLE